jgi:hypothetical protein
MVFMKNKYGFRPTVTNYQCAVVVDNLSGEIIPFCHAY